MKLDRSSWIKVKLTDVVTKQEENDRENAKKHFDRFLKVEHLDAESLHVRRWATQKGGDELPPTFYKIFRKGQILFPTRNPHLRRTALASFDGICGEKTLTLQANLDRVLPDFLPFLFHSDSFYRYTTSSIVGSTNPHVRWRDVAKFEFLLPPKEQQKSIAKLLWGIDDLIQIERQVLDAQLLLKLSAAKDYLLGKNINGPTKKSPYGDIPQSWKLIPLFDLRCLDDKHSFTGGPFGSNLKSEHYTEEGVRVLQLQNIGNGEFLDQYKIYTSEDKADELKSCNIYPGEIILAKMAPVGRCAIIPDDDSRYVMCSDGIRLKVDSDKYDNGFIYHAINTTHFLKYTESKCSGTTRSRITLNDLKKIPIVIPDSKEHQVELRKKFDQIDMVVFKLKSKMDASKKVCQALINRVF